MRIVKFKNSDHFAEEFEYAGKYCWYLGECDGVHIFAPLTANREIVELCSDTLNVVNNGGRVIAANNNIFGKDYDINTPEDVRTMIGEVLPESFVRSMMNVDDALYYESEGIEKFIRYNSNVHHSEWTSEEILNPARTVGQLVTIYSMRELPLMDESIVWLNANKFDSVCEVLQRVDAHQISTSSNSCGCGQTSEIGNTCSALKKYIDYKNERTVEDFGNMEFVSKLFFTTINDELVFNDELAEKLISFAEAWSNEEVAAASLFDCPCTVLNAELVNLVNQLKKALDFLKEGNESFCLHEKFITYWISRFIEYIL